MPVDQEMAGRLRWARESAGYAARVDAMRAFGWPPVYDQHENGIRGFDKHVNKYARAYRVREEWLRYGRGLPREAMQSIIIGGRIGPFGIVNATENQLMSADGSRLIDAPPGDAGEYSAFIVDGDHNYPSLFSGDVVYTAKPEPPIRVLGKQCIATMADGSRRVCILARGTSAGLYLVLSINATPTPDAEVIDAAPIVWIKRG